jgi:energy-coupling factor transporter ATP-binding protein EcfA2
LGNSYSDIDFTTITHESKRTEVGRLTRDGARYSENNMGFGEGRILYLVDLLEKSPSNSLIILEEPETSLHPVAQYNLSQYLLDVVHRKKHQIVLTTHSESILSGLPVESRKFLLRQGSTIHVIDGISSTHAASFLTGNHLPALTIAVEDEFAQQLLVELLRKKNAELLNRVLIKPAGDTKAVAQAVKILNDNNKNAIAIRDGDKGEDHPKRLYKLPGTMAPEKEVIQNDSVKNLLETYYDINVEAFLGEYHDLDHHEYFEKLAAKAHVRINTLETECSRRYVEALESEEIDRIYNLVAGNL